MGCGSSRSAGRPRKIPPPPRPEDRLVNVLPLPPIIVTQDEATDSGPISTAGQRDIDHTTAKHVPLDKPPSGRGSLAKTKFEINPLLAQLKQPRDSHSGSLGNLPLMSTAEMGASQATDTLKSSSESMIHVYTKRTQGIRQEQDKNSLISGNADRDGDRRELREATTEEKEATEEKDFTTQEASPAAETEPEKGTTLAGTMQEEKETEKDTAQEEIGTAQEKDVATETTQNLPGEKETQENREEIPQNSKASLVGATHNSDGDRTTPTTTDQEVVHR